MQKNVPFSLVRSLVVTFYVGSHAHGTYVPPEDPTGFDDQDLMIVVIPPPEYVLGLRRWEHGQYKEGRHDVVLYDWSKWLRMIVKSNPNVIGTLWSHPEDVIRGYSTEFAPLNMLFEQRGRLISKRMFDSFIGYAKGQLYKMEHFAHQGYMGEKRKHLVERFGYDVKNAAHLIRLMRQACETMETGRLLVRRPDAAELIDIKQGKWTKERIVEEANALFARAEEALRTTTLPDNPDEVLIEQVMIEGYKRWWGSNWR